jgi:curli biogenesis system outer membrane secretion channel CsgG
MMEKRRMKMVVLISLILCCAGCASVPVVEPTFEELEASKAYKKTVAIIEFTDEGSPIKGVQSAALSKLESMLVGHLNVVERRKVDRILAEREFVSTSDLEGMQELGSLLGAEYLFFGNVIASVGEPEIRHDNYTTDAGEFRGNIWEEVCGRTEVSIRIVDVTSGIVYYSGKRKASNCKESQKQQYSNEARFRKDLELRRNVGHIAAIVKRFANLERESSYIVTKALEDATARFNYDLRNKFAQSGEVIKIISPKEVMINLGSAYGIKPGDKLIVWQEKDSVRDPRTGMTAISRKKKGVLKVTGVTSGLTCIAKGKKKLISTLRIGDRVFTH